MRKVINIRELVRAARAKELAVVEEPPSAEDDDGSEAPTRAEGAS